MHPEVELVTLAGRTLRIVRLQRTPTDKMPLMIMADGQNLFDDETAGYGRSWRIIEQWKQHHLPSVCIVGIDNLPGMERLDEYSPFINSTLVGQYDWITRPVGGKGDQFLHFITKKVIPYVYQTIPHLAPLPATIGGSSMGGLISLYAVLRYPEYFHQAACVSNAFWFAPEPLIDTIQTVSLDHITHIYLDVGTAEVGLKYKSDYLVTNQAVVDALLARNFHRFDYHIFGGGIHNEADWEQRIPLIMNTLFNTSKGATHD